METLLGSSTSRAETGSLPERGRGDTVLDEVRDLCRDDHAYTDGTVFNSICSAPLEIARRVYAEHLDANLGDNRIYPSLRRAEAQLSAMLGELLGHPGAVGVTTSGGTEANLLAVLAAVRRHRSRSGGRGGPARIVLPESAHFSFDKIVGLLPVEPVYAPLDERLRVRPAELARLVTADTALVVATAGTSEAGAVDDVPAVAEHTAALGVPLHVDAATGGFLIPFARELGHELPPFAFDVPGVTSVTLDPHKYGGVPIPSGHLLLRDGADAELLRTASHYRGTVDHHGLLGTRPGAAVLAAWAALRALGRDGYRDLVGGVFARRDLLLGLLRAAGFEVAVQPQLTVVTVRHPEPERLVDALERRGFIASVARRYGLLRLVVHWHQTEEQLRALVAAMADADARAEGGAA
ncbi:tyrosine decarboxylase MfnA [Streptomyces sp. NBC_00334]|uniref:tyrosine decarboxylase MfnA n=1 Tax=Streptomyces sp. NBC_00334 TaxID=2975713 RepID=UPI002E28D630|nr:tyrosine decarboxylase MfnA [Streptomyces sp. NBC_00334]